MRVHAVFIGPTDTDMSRDLQTQKATPESVARALDSPEAADFVTGLDLISKAVHRAPGFVWRLERASDIGGPYGDDVLVNLTVWESVASLRDFTFTGGHFHYFKRRAEWLDHSGLPGYSVLWWVRRDHRPSLDEAVERLEYLAQHGPTEYAFTFRQPMAAPAE